MTICALGDWTPTLPRGFFWVADNATVVGNVGLGENVGVWFGAVVRGDNDRIEIGAGSNVQDLAVLHTDTGLPLIIGEGCTIGHRAILHGCRVGRNSLVGMGATVLNGATIGENCLIGAGALVTEGKVVPDNSLVIGSPGRVARVLTGAEVERLKSSAVGYVENARRFLAELQPVQSDR